MTNEKVQAEMRRTAPHGTFALRSLDAREPWHFKDLVRARILPHAS